mgnify:CR=1 FL=1
MMENLILLAFGMAAICGFILGAQLFVWVWDLWEKRLEKTYPEPRRKAVEDYWKGAA